MLAASVQRLTCFGIYLFRQNISSSNLLAYMNSPSFRFRVLFLFNRICVSTQSVCTFTLTRVFCLINLLLFCYRCQNVDIQVSKTFFNIKETFSLFKFNLIHHGYFICIKVLRFRNFINQTYLRSILLVNRNFAYNLE